MDLQQIRYFLELSRELHFWKTSEKMFITQSALSRQIQSLEDELGILLFERTKRSVKLTEAGRFLFEKWEKLIREIDSMHKHAKQIGEGKFGSIMIGYPGSIIFGFLPILLTSVAKESPDLKVELVEPTDVTFEQWLLSYQMDLGFRRQPAENPTLESKCLYSENFALVVPDDHHLNEENFSDLKVVKDEKFILSKLDHKTLYVESLLAIFKTYDFTPDVFIETDFGAAILSLVSKGLGISILPSSYAFGAFQGVKFLKIPQKISLYVIWRKHDNNPVLKNLLRQCEEIAKNYLNLGTPFN